MTNEEALKQLQLFAGTMECPSLEAIEIAIEALKQNQWIPCSERLPAEKQDVLMIFKGNMAVGFWEDILGDGNPVWYANSGDGWFTDTETVDSDGVPLAWMPLPERYEEEKR